MKSQAREAKPPQVTYEYAAGRFAGWDLVFHRSWGSDREASIHPGLYAIAALRGLRRLALQKKKGHPTVTF